MLTAKLHCVISQLVWHAQMVFIREHSIHNDWIVASEVLDAMKRRRQDLILKLNFKKAYDKVGWHFIGFMMCHMGFGIR